VGPRRGRGEDPAGRISSGRDGCLIFNLREGLTMFAPFGYFFAPGPMELLIVAVIVLLLFGNRLPSVMRSLGRGVVEFKKGIQGIEEDVDKAGSDKKKED